MSMNSLRRGLLLAAIVPALFTAGCAAGGTGQAMKGAASPASPTATDTGMTPGDSASPTDTTTGTGSPSPTDTGAGQGSPRGVVESFYKALESGDSAQVVKLFTSDAVAAVAGEQTAEGTQALTTLFEGMGEGQGGTPTIEESQVAGKQAFVRATSGQGSDETRAFFLLTQDNGDWKIDRYMSNSPS
ncbi:nuclear transport factor 2 family protein [Nonomuraea sp. NPDC049725]|uniref:YybH family protein n=1 Tax=Nonomuraea sp. NPDC049725 TaxID=3154508 RepID=UPI00343FC9CF